MSAKRPGPATPDLSASPGACELNPIGTVAAVERRGVGFRSLNEAIDTTTFGGRLVFRLFAAFGQAAGFERSARV